MPSQMVLTVLTQRYSHASLLYCCNKCHELNTHSRGRSTKSVLSHQSCVGVPLRSQLSGLFQRCRIRLERSCTGSCSSRLTSAADGDCRAFNKSRGSSVAIPARVLFRRACQCGCGDLRTADCSFAGGDNVDDETIGIFFFRVTGPFTF